ncbi:hypothetical protein H6G83_18230 [Anabaena azotica FACHB-119]|uniref:Restriction endonuclease type IV Mrr domain-containing protein n=2 Tax=Anabaena azotica TaxID=197653 RepID=A0ABR8D5U3_9NOST|nr:hypothetical protein [Anabaena azotica FACHB-119]
MARDKFALFSGRQFSSFSRGKLESIFQDIDNLDASNLLNTSLDNWCDFYENSCKFEMLEILEDEITTDQEEALVPVMNPYRGYTQEKGTKFNFFIPFKGEKELFSYQSSVLIGDVNNTLLAQIDNNEIILEYTEWHPEIIRIQSQFKQDLSKIRENIRYINQEVSAFNNSIRTKIKSKLESRQQKLLQDQNLVAALGYPLRRRDNTPETYVVPTVRRKISIPRPSASTTPFIPEPTLDMQEYEHILSVINNMVMVMEKSPKAFKDMREEDLRQHFLVQLNGHYEGQATGETFNFQGKTDILIRAGNRNIFIAECKFWGGEEKLKETLDQLLGYTSWRDTKIALIIFNRNKNFSAVVKQIPKIIKSHGNFKRELDYNCETGFRCLLHHPDDVNRELILTSLAFDVPQ